MAEVRGKQKLHDFPFNIECRIEVRERNVAEVGGMPKTHTTTGITTRSFGCAAYKPGRYACDVNDLVQTHNSSSISRPERSPAGTDSSSVQEMLLEWDVEHHHSKSE